MADTIINKSMRKFCGVTEFDVDHVGPASYVPISGVGDSLKLGPGMDKGTLNMQGGISDDGQYEVFPVPLASAGMPKLSAVELMWVVRTTGVEVAAAVNLSARHVRIRATTV